MTSFNLGEGPNPDSDRILPKNHPDIIRNKIRAAIEFGSELSLSLARKVDATSEVANSNGIWRHNHMQESQAEAVEFAKHLGFDDVCADLFQLISATHDLGRFEEAYRKATSGDALMLDGVEPCHHGVYSRLIIEKAGVLHNIPDELKEAVLSAIEQHGVLQVTLTEGTLAWKLCYALRDLDKLEIFRQDALYAAKNTDLGVEHALLELGSWLAENQAHYNLLTRDSTLAKRAIRMSLYDYSPEKLDEFYSSFPSEAQFIDSCLNASIDSASEAVLAHKENRCADVSKCLTTYAEFLAMQLAMIYDVQYPHTFTMIDKLGLCDFRLDFISKRCQRQDFELIKESVLAKIVEGKNF